MSEALLVHMMFAEPARCRGPLGQRLDRRSVLAGGDPARGERLTLALSPGPALAPGSRIVTHRALFEVEGGGTDSGCGYQAYGVRCLRARSRRPVDRWLSWRQPGRFRRLARAPAR